MVYGIQIYNYRILFNLLCFWSDSHPCVLIGISGKAVKLMTFAFDNLYDVIAVNSHKPQLANSETAELSSIQADSSMKQSDDIEGA